MFGSGAITSFQQRMMIAPPAPGSILVKERLSLRITLKNFLLNHSRNINTNTIFRILHTFIGLCIGPTYLENCYSIFVVVENLSLKNTLSTYGIDICPFFFFLEGSPKLG